MRFGQEIGARCFLAFVLALCWPRSAYADISMGAIIGIFSWLLLLPLGLLQMIMAAMIRRHLKRSQVGATGLLVTLTVGAALLIPRVVDLDHVEIGAVVAGLGFVPGLPVVVDLMRQRAWSASVLAFVLLPVPVALIILEGVGRQ
jgi:hypothetical protein